MSRSHQHHGRRVRYSEGRRVEVTARLQSGVVMPSMFPLPLDGILASVAHRRKMADRYGSDHDHHIDPLPLCITSKELGARWVWVASCATPLGPAGTEVRYWHNRGWDETAADQVVSSIPANTEVGRFKAWRVPMVVTVTSGLRWQALGDPDGIRGLLADVLQLGQKRSQGEGLVLAWSVTDLGSIGDGVGEHEAATLAVLFDADGRPTRPIPARAAARFGVAGCDTIRHTTRPPYFRPRQENIGHGFERVMPEVIAPWAQRTSEMPTVSAGG